MDAHLSGGVLGILLQIAPIHAELLQRLHELVAVGIEPDARDQLGPSPELARVIGEGRRRAAQPIAVREFVPENLANADDKRRWACHEGALSGHFAHQAIRKL
jgi:hypothetical protein